jgi:hypothetical protein
MQDNFDEAISKLNSITVLLYGKYYERKSNRDIMLARRLTELLSEVKIWHIKVKE